jgi:Domain of unknown function (DUF4157)
MRAERTGAVDSKSRQSTEARTEAPVRPSGHGAGLQDLQRAAGNRAVVEILRVGQARLEVGASDDPYEREADQVARQVVESLRSGLAGVPGTGREDDDQSVQRIMRRSPVGAAGGALDPETESAISSARGGGTPLAGSARQSMEQAFGGADFGDVRLHSGAGAASLNRAVSAEAFTIGSDIFFSGPVPDASPKGQELLAHELTHTIQQGGASQSTPSADPEEHAVARMLRLQRRVGRGNAGAGVIRRVAGSTAVEFETGEGLERGSGTVDTLNGVLGSFDSIGGAQGGEYLAGNSNSPTAEGGMGSSGISMITGTYGFVSGASKTHSGRKRYEQAKLTGDEKTAEGRNALRDVKTGVGNMVNSAGSVGSQAVSFSGSLAQTLSNSNITSTFASQSNLLGGIGGAIALPFALLGTLRTMRKTAKQYDRFRKLRAKVEDPATSAKEAEKALVNAKNSIAVAQDLVVAATSDLEEVKKRHAKVKKPDAAVLNEQKLELETKQEVLNKANDMVKEAQEQEQKAIEARDKIADGLKEKQKRADNQEESADDIRAYAMTKNQNGFIKKLIATVGGLLGIGGGIAATLASFAFVGAGVAGVSAAMATPVGWALAGAAALIGLGAGIYAFGKWANKRFKQLEKNDDKHVKAGGDATPKWKLRMRSLLPWVKVDRESRRDHMAERLFDLAVGTDVNEAAKAKEVLTALGLDFTEMKMDKTAIVSGATVPDPKMRKETVALIAAKMAS